jgi:plastocyanin
MRRWLRLVGLVFALGLVFAACSDDSGDDGGGGDAASDSSADAGSGSCDADVCLENTAFNPDTVTISVGDSVTWANVDGVDHTVTADDGAFDEQLSDGDSVEETFDEAGDFTYHCEIHPSMTGTITVE